jgi:peptidylprolyl isomerase
VRSRVRVPFALIAAVVAVVALTTACGSSNSSSGSTDSQSPTTSASTQCPTPAASVPSNLPAVTGAAGKAPTIAKPSGNPPSQLVCVDLITGKGTPVTSTDTVTVQYVGMSWSTGTVFDSSWSRGQPATFPLNEVIQGWSEGLVGMQVGGRRELVIPPGLGYGDTPPQGSGIKAGETLVFVVDLLSIQS